MNRVMNFGLLEGIFSYFCISLVKQNKMSLSLDVNTGSKANQ